MALQISPISTILWLIHPPFSLCVCHSVSLSVSVSVSVSLIVGTASHNRLYRVHPVHSKLTWAATAESCVLALSLWGGREVTDSPVLMDYLLISVNICYLNICSGARNIICPAAAYHSPRAFLNPFSPECSFQRGDGPRPLTALQAEEGQLERPESQESPHLPEAQGEVSEGRRWWRCEGPWSSWRFILCLLWLIYWSGTSWSGLSYVTSNSWPHLPVIAGKGLTHSWRFQILGIGIGSLLYDWSILWCNCEKVGH